MVVEFSSDAFTSQMSFRTKIFHCIFQLKLHISKKNMTEFLFKIMFYMKCIGKYFSVERFLTITYIEINYSAISEKML